MDRAGSRVFADVSWAVISLACFRAVLRFFSRSAMTGSIVSMLCLFARIARIDRVTGVEIASGNAWSCVVDAASERMCWATLLSNCRDVIFFYFLFLALVLCWCNGVYEDDENRK